MISLLEFIRASLKPSRTKVMTFPLPLITGTINLTTLTATDTVTWWRYLIVMDRARTAKIL